MDGLTLQTIGNHLMYHSKTSRVSPDNRTCVGLPLYSLRKLWYKWDAPPWPKIPFMVNPNPNKYIIDYRYLLQNNIYMKKQIYDLNGIKLDIIHTSRHLPYINVLWTTSKRSVEENNVSMSSLELYIIVHCMTMYEINRNIFVKNKVWKKLCMSYYTTIIKFLIFLCKSLCAFLYIIRHIWSDVSFSRLCRKMVREEYNNKQMSH